MLRWFSNHETSPISFRYDLRNHPSHTYPFCEVSDDRRIAKLQRLHSYTISSKLSFRNVRRLTNCECIAFSYQISMKCSHWPMHLQTICELRCFYMSFRWMTKLCVFVDECTDDSQGANLIPNSFRFR